MDNVLLDVKDLKVTFPVFGGVLQRKVAEIKAVDGVSFTVFNKETFGLVGESGSGKSTVGKAIISVLKITAPYVDVKGAINLCSNNEKVNLLELSRKKLLPYRKHIQMIFQDPYSSLNPRMLAGDIIREPLDINTPHLSTHEKNRKVAQLLDKVGLTSEQATRYPHEFSGGQRQRIGIARSLATNPKLIIADEPVSALDVSIQAQVINLMQDLQEEFGLSFIFIAHNLSLVEHLSNRIAVMYLGNIVEIGSSDEIYHHPKHPYSKSLLSAVPLPEPSQKRAKRQILKGDIPSPLNKPSGCGFRNRCPIAKPDCALSVPEFKDFGNGHAAACPYSG